MIDYLNPHHIYPDTQAAPDLSAEVKRGANIIPETDKTLHKSVRTDANKGAKIMDNQINQQYGSDTETPAARIIRLYRSGMSHVDIAGRGFDMAEVRRVISEATRVDETLYQVHKGVESRWSKRSATGGEQ